MKKILIILAIGIMLFSLVGGEITIGDPEEDDFDDVINLLTPDPPFFFNNTGSVNSSDFWDNLDTPADINTGDLTDDNTYVQITGDNMTGSLQINTTDNSALSVWDSILAYATFLVDTDSIGERIVKIRNADFQITDDSDTDVFLYDVSEDEILFLSQSEFREDSGMFNSKVFYFGDRQQSIYSTSVGDMGVMNIQFPQAGQFIVQTAESLFDYPVKNITYFYNNSVNFTVPIIGTDISITGNMTADYGFFNYTGIGVAIPLHNIDIIGDFLLTHTATTTDEHGLELKVDAAGFGDVKGIDLIYDTGAITTGQDAEAILINLDTSDSTGGSVAGVEVLRTGNTAEVHGLLTGIEIDPILQFTGVFGNMDSVDNNGDDDLAEFISTTSNVTMFTNDNDYVTIGSATHFEEIEFILELTASINIKPTFEFSTGIGAWTTFTPTDGTNGFENTGVIIWELSDVPTWNVGAGGEYLIRITRTKNNINTVPIENLVQISDVTEYYWDKRGYLFINNLTASGNITTDWLFGKLNSTNIIEPFWVNKSGDSMLGILDMGGNDIEETGTIYIGDQFGGAIPRSIYPDDFGDMVINASDDLFLVGDSIQIQSDMIHISDGSASTATLRFETSSGGANLIYRGTSTQFEMPGSVLIFNSNKLILSPTVSSAFGVNLSVQNNDELLIEAADSVDMVTPELNVTGNFTLGDKITFRLGEVIDNLIDGWLTITGNLNVTGDLNIDGEISGDRLLVGAGDNGAVSTAGGAKYMEGYNGVLMSATEGYVAHRDGSLTALSTNLGIGGVAGTWTMEFMVNGAAAGLTNTGATGVGGDSTDYDIQLRNIDTFVAGDILAFRLTVTGVGAATDDIFTLAEIVYNFSFLIFLIPARRCFR